MAAPYEEMGYELKLLVGPPGTAATLNLTIATNIDYDNNPTKGETTDRGTSGVVPIQTENVTKHVITITFTTNNDADDAQLLLLIQAQIAGLPMALKLVTVASNVTLFDGDVTFSKKYNAPLDGPGTYDWTATPTKAGGRRPTLG